MLDYLDDALRDFVVRELPIRSGEIDIAFEQPRREWSARLNRPTINLYLRGLAENTRLRANQPAITNMTVGDKSTLQRNAVFVDARYIITAWAADPLDEHRILSRLLAPLLRTRALPAAFITKYWPEYVGDIPLQVAQGDNQLNPSDIWSVLDNEMRPIIDLVATLRFNPFEVTETPVVRTSMLTIKQITTAPSVADSAVGNGVTDSQASATSHTAMR